MFSQIKEDAAVTTLQQRTISFKWLPISPRITSKHAAVTRNHSTAPKWTRARLLLHLQCLGAKLWSICKIIAAGTHAPQFRIHNCVYAQNGQLRLCKYSTIRSAGRRKILLLVTSAWRTKNGSLHVVLMRLQILAQCRNVYPDWMRNSGKTFRERITVLLSTPAMFCQVSTSIARARSIFCVKRNALGLHINILTTVKLSADIFKKWR